MMVSILFTKTAAAQNEVSYLTVRGLYFIEVIFAATKLKVSYSVSCNAPRMTKL